MSFITVGLIISRIKEDGFFSFSRPTFYRLEKQGAFEGVPYNRTSSNHRTFSKQAAIEILSRIYGEYFGKDKAGEYKEMLEKEDSENKLFPHIQIS